MNFKTTKIVAMLVAFAVFVSGNALAAAADEIAYDIYFSEDRPFFTEATSSSKEALAVSDSYLFIFGKNDSVALFGLPSEIIQNLIPGYLYSKNWRNDTLSLFIPMEITAFTYSEDKSLYVAESGGTIYQYSLDGICEKKVVTVPYIGTCSISRIIANESIIFFISSDTIYRYYIPTGVLDNLGYIDESSLISFTAISNNEVEWVSRTDTWSDEEDQYINERYTKNLVSGVVSLSEDRPIVDPTIDENSARGNPILQDYFSTTGMACHCHDLHGNPNVKCTCETGLWYDASGQEFSGIQCYGYALAWYKNRHGDRDPRTISPVNYHVGTDITFADGNDDETVNANIAMLCDMLDDYCYGAHIRSDSPHSLIVLDPTYTPGAMYITDANRSAANDCIIKKESMSYETFVKKYKHITRVWTRPHEYTYVPAIGYVCNGCGEILENIN